MKTVAFLPAHPAQLWLMAAIEKALPTDVRVLWVLRDKDVLVAVAEKLGLDYVIISRAQSGMLGNALELLIGVFRAMRLTRKHRIDLWLTKYGSGNIGAALCRVPSLSFNDDDIDIVPLIAMTSYPFARKVITPANLRMGRYDHKTIRYNGSHELVYLHPDRFTLDPSRLAQAGLDDRPYILVRLSALAAHHDVGVAGVSVDAVSELIARYGDDYRIVISSEKPLPDALQPYRMRAEVDQIHHLLAGASCLVTDSLSMALEAAVLGTATVRLSDFGLELTAFSAIEPYELVFNFKPDDVEPALAMVESVLQMQRDGEVAERSRRLVSDKDDPLPVFVEAILEQLR